MVPIDLGAPLLAAITTIQSTFPTLFEHKGVIQPPFVAFASHRPIEESSIELIPLRWHQSLTAQNITASEHTLCFRTVEQLRARSRDAGPLVKSGTFVVSGKTRHVSIRGSMLFIFKKASREGGKVYIFYFFKKKIKKNNILILSDSLNYILLFFFFF